MAQLHCSVDEETATRLAEEAEKRGVSMSGYLAEIVRRELPEQWPEGYLHAIVGSCASFPLEKPAPLPLDDIEL
jgi:hypothetical protein